MDFVALAAANLYGSPFCNNGTHQRNARPSPVAIPLPSAVLADGLERSNQSSAGKGSGRGWHA